MEFLLMSPPAGQEGGLLPMMFPFIAVFLIMWFIVIRPQKKEQQERQAMLKNIKKGDKVVTIGGIVGKVTKVTEDRIELKVDESNNTKLTFFRTSIQNIIPKDSQKAKKEQ